MIHKYVGRTVSPRVEKNDTYLCLEKIGYVNMMVNI